jgi:hypothetical protein
MGELFGELMIAIIDVLRPTSRAGKVIWVLLLLAGIAAIIVANVRP